MKCVKCQSEMELGFTADLSGRVAPVWNAGPLRWSVFGTLLRKRARFYVQTLRCVQCGYLESYAK